jgi:hypothetical protein
MIAYLDTQVFDHIYKKIGCTGADIANLRKAIYGRELSIRLSLHTLEEILLARRISPQAFAAQIKLTLSLANSRALIKPCEQLLLDDIRAYAERGQADRPFLRGDMQNSVADGLAALIESDGEELEEDFVAVLDQARQQKQQFFAAVERAQQQASAVSGPASGATSSEQYFDAAASSALESLAERAGVGDSCRERGLDGLLRVKSVRMTLGAVLASSHAQIAAGAPANPTTIHHAVSAAAVAETFVSDDAPMRQLLGHIPMDRLDVTSLPDFLKRLSARD